MAAGGFKEFVAGETLDEDEINDFLMQGMLVFAGTAARGSAIPAPVEGQFSFRTDDDVVEFYDGSDWVEFSGGGVEVLYVLVGPGGAGGGSTGSNRAGGGGGAGGYRCNVTGENSGANSSAEGSLTLVPGTYPLSVPAGAAGVIATTPPNVSGVTTFASLIAPGGGYGGNAQGGHNGQGGSAGGCGTSANVVARTAIGGLTRLGTNGGNSSGADGTTAGGGGGGAEIAGANGVTGTGGNGGAGLASSITGSSVTRAGGGGGGGATTAGTGGAGGGGNGGAVSANGSSGAANTGGGGGGARTPLTGNNTGGNGGSGVVIFAVPTGTSVSFSGGVTETNSTVGDNTVFIVTAAGPTDTFTIG